MPNQHHLPKLVNQFHDGTAARQPWKPFKVSGHKARDYTGVMCGDSVAAMALDFATGAQTLGPTDFRKKSGVFSDTGDDAGLKRSKVAEMLADLLDSSLVHEHLVTFPEFRQRMQLPGHFICLLVDNATFPGCGTTVVDHYVGLATNMEIVGEHGGRLWPAWDPTCDEEAPNPDLPDLPRGVHWRQSSRILEAADVWSSKRGHPGEASFIVVRRKPNP